MKSKSALAIISAVSLVAFAAVTTLDSIIKSASNPVKAIPKVQYAVGEIVDKYAVAPSLSSNLYGITVPRIVPVFAESNLSVRFYDTNNHVNVNMIVNDPIYFNRFSKGDKVALEFAVSQEAVRDESGKITNYAVNGYHFRSLAKQPNLNTVITK